MATNIRYNYRTYYSSSGVGKTDIKKMLRYKSGICLDYASLMDTLCEIAGITNVTIYGYAKDEIFDVHDSIYIDNHAWNAVKLDGRWYLYDVTYATGYSSYDYTNFTKFINKILLKHPVKYKQKRYREKNIRTIVDDCGNISTTPSYYYKKKIWNSILRYFILRFKTHIKSIYVKSINKDFYLTNPELFSITHYPDNPIWSLTKSTNIKNYESDSAFYYYNDSSLKYQERIGRICTACDYDLSLEPLAKARYFLKNSIEFNKKNKVIASLCEFNIGEIYFNKSVDLVDSAEKVTTIDSSLNNVVKCKQSLKSAYKNVDIDFILQKRKNKNKQMLLLKENTGYINFIKEKINTTYAQKLISNNLNNRTKVNTRKYKRKRTAIKHLRDDIHINPNSKLAPNKLIELNYQIKQKQYQIDSLNSLINKLKFSFDSIATNLSLNIWQRVLYHDLLMTPIRKTTDLRYKLKDNFKKQIVDIRKQILNYETNYTQDLYNLVYMPTKNIFDFGINLFNDIDIRNSFEVDNYHSKLLLAKFNELDLKELKTFKENISKQIKEDYCWLKSKYPTIKSIMNGYQSLKDKQYETISTVLTENYVERLRTHYMSRELLRRKKKYRHIIVNNGVVANKKLVIIKKEKRNYLNQLKKEHKEVSKK